MTTTIDKKKYLELMDTADISPKVIETENEYDRFLAVAEKLMHKRLDRLGGALRVRARNQTLNKLVAQAQELNMGYK
jgi:hypothetical protein